MMNIFFAVLLMTGLGILLGIAIGVVEKFFKTEEDPRIDLVAGLLPGANCGGCGYAGCADLAKAIVNGVELPSKCPVSSQDQANSIANAIGIEMEHGHARKAVVACSGDRSMSLKLLNYNGTLDCLAASVVSGGPKACKFGCLGMGSCVRACPFGAIEIVNSLAVIHHDLCVGCGKCVSVCPRHVIKLVPADAMTHVYCNSTDPGVEKRKYCKAACIGCGKCVRTLPELFNMNAGLATVNYAAEYDNTSLQGVKCPVNVLHSIEAHYLLHKSEDRTNE